MLSIAVMVIVDNGAHRKSFALRCLIPRDRLEQQRPRLLDQRRVLPVLRVCVCVCVCVCARARELACVRACEWVGG